MRSKSPCLRALEDELAALAFLLGDANQEQNTPDRKAARDIKRDDLEDAANTSKKD